MSEEEFDEEEFDKMIALSIENSKKDLEADKDIEADIEQLLLRIDERKNERVAIAEEFFVKDFDSVHESLLYLDERKEICLPYSEFTFFVRFMVNDDDLLNENDNNNDNGNNKNKFRISNSDGIENGSYATLDLSFFSKPDESSEYYDTFLLLSEIYSTEKEAWKKQLSSKLSFITSCSNFAISYLNKVYEINTEDEMINSDNDLDRQLYDIKNASLESRPKLLSNFIKNNDVSNIPILLKIEIDGNHVYLIDIYKNKFYILESMIFICDCDIYEIDELEFHKILKFQKEEYDVFDIHTYDQFKSVDNLKLLVEQCYNINTLNTEILYFDQKKTWNQLLDLVFKLRTLTNNRNKNNISSEGIWKNLSQYIDI